MTLPPNARSFAESLAASAAEIAKHYFRQPVPTDWKADNSPVTQADRAIERKLREQIQAYYPDHGIFGEEEAPHAPDARWQWVIDPIDGTRSFLAGRPLFTTLIALCDRETPIMGLISQPITGELWLGIRGQFPDQNGAWLNHQPIRTRPCESISQALLATTSPHYFTPDGHAYFESLRTQSRDTLYGGDAYLYALLATGHIDLIAEEGLKWFDVAALVPIIESAGGKATGWDGSPLTAHSHSRVLACGNTNLSLNLTGTSL